MYLTNYYNYKGYTISHTPSSGGYAQIDIGLKNLSGNTWNLLYQANGGNIYQFGYLVSNWCFNSGIGVLLGTDDTVPTVNDYQLGNDITASISNLTYNITTSGTGSNVTTTITITGTNNTGSDIIINELGVYKAVYDSTLATSDILMLRSLIDPIEIANGESFSRTFTWTEGELAA